jgi:hypothetical protein
MPLTVTLKTPITGAYEQPTGLYAPNYPDVPQ